MQRNYIIRWIEREGDSLPCKTLVSRSFLYGPGILNTFEKAKEYALSIIDERPKRVTTSYECTYKHCDNDRGRYIIRYERGKKKRHIYEKELTIIETEPKI